MSPVKGSPSDGTAVFVLAASSVVGYGCYSPVCDPSCRAEGGGAGSLPCGQDRCLQYIPALCSSLLRHRCHGEGGGAGQKGLPAPSLLPLLLFAET